MISARQFIGSNQCYYNNGESTGYCNSAWYEWGRWVLFGALAVAAILLFFVLSCISARRRRRFGRQPFYGTGWAAHGVPQYNPNYQTQQPVNNYNATPAYGYQQNGGYYGRNQGYFGGQETGTEMQPPTNSYRAGDDVYHPPTGPPPKKTGYGV